MLDAPLPSGVTRQVALEKCDYFLEVQLWPLKAYVDPAAWLRNFTDGEQEHALYLLHAFQYYSEQLTDELFQAAFQGLSLEVCSPEDPLLTAQTKWNSFLAQALVTYVEGENPNPTDSGFTFARKARQLVGIDEANILSNVDSLTAVLSAHSAVPVIFVDDFVGSGDQFAKTWARQRHLPSLRIQTSFAEVASKRGGDFYYCPLIATETGVKRIAGDCPDVHLLPVHVLTDRDSALAIDSHIWPAHLQSTALQFIKDTSARVGIPDWRGYADLGLTIAFRHSVPDATLPLFYWEQNGWTPLVRRS